MRKSKKKRVGIWIRVSAEDQVRGRTTCQRGDDVHYAMLRRSRAVSVG